MKKLILAFSALCFNLLAGPLAMAFDDDDVMSFDAIVNDLKGSTTARLEPRDPLDDVLLYAGLGLATTFVEIQPENGSSRSGFLSGVEANFGIDLFSKSWQAETSLRSFNRESLGQNLDVSLKEFDLKVVHTIFLSSRNRVRLNGGLAARYLKADSSETRLHEYTTPASILGCALTTHVTSSLAFGADVSLRSSMISESIDRSSLNASLRLDAKF